MKKKNNKHQSRAIYSRQNNNKININKLVLEAVDRLQQSYLYLIITRVKPVLQETTKLFFMPSRKFPRSRNQKQLVDIFVKKKKIFMTQQINTMQYNMLFYILQIIPESIYCTVSRLHKKERNNIHQRLAHVTNLVSLQTKKIPTPDFIGRYLLISIKLTM